MKTLSTLLALSLIACQPADEAEAPFPEASPSPAEAASPGADPPRRSSAAISAEPEPEPDETPEWGYATPSCDHLVPVERPRPDCEVDSALEIEVQALDGDEWPTLINPEFTADTHLAAAFVVEGAEVRWALAGPVPYGVQIDPLTGRLDSHLQWPGTFEVVAYTEGEACRMNAYTVATEPAACAILVEPSKFEWRAELDALFRRPLHYWDFEGPSPGSLGQARWRLVGGALPPGMKIDCERGVLTGEPTRAGDYAFEVEWIEYNCGGVAVVDSYKVVVR